MLGNVVQNSIVNWQDEGNHISKHIFDASVWKYFHVNVRLVSCISKAADLLLTVL